MGVTDHSEKRRCLLSKRLLKVGDEEAENVFVGVDYLVRVLLNSAVIDAGDDLLD
jgi:hypothetical protein